MRERLSTVAGRDVSRETKRKIEKYVALLTEASARQNLIAPSTLGAVWERHVLDSAQLVALEPYPGASWVDVGSGAGVPGIIIALLVEGPVTLVEPRRLRAEFLEDCVRSLSLKDRVTVEQAKAERLNGRFGVITGRAVAALDKFLAITHHLSKDDTVWVLPKGKNAQTELAEAQVNWHCDVRVEQSRTDPGSEILVLTRVGAKKRR